MSARIKLKKIQSCHLEQITIKTKNLRETFAVFEEYKSSTYSVAWIDCLARSNKIGRGFLKLDELQNDGRLNYCNRREFNIPLTAPGFVLNRWSAKVFNATYYGKLRDRITRQSVNIDTFFIH